MKKKQNRTAKVVTPKIAPPKFYEVDKGTRVFIADHAVIILRPSDSKVNPWTATVIERFRSGTDFLTASTLKGALNAAAEVVRKIQYKRNEAINLREIAKELIWRADRILQ